MANDENKKNPLKDSAGRDDLLSEIVGYSLNKLINALWPELQKYVPKVFEEYLEPRLKEQMPSRFPPVDLKKFVIGTYLR